MIDPQTETLITLAEAARMLPGRRSGKSLSLRSVIRYSLAGVPVGSGRVYLETCKVGGLRRTTRQAVDRFIAACNGRPQPSARPPQRDDVASQLAAAELERAAW